jgi:hypothetical protein
MLNIHREVEITVDEVIVANPQGGGAKRVIAPTGNFCFKTIVNLIPCILIIT